jgi:hypothetical protein
MDGHEGELYLQKPVGIYMIISKSDMMRKRKVPWGEKE